MRRSYYNDDELICDLVSARLPLRQIAAKHNMTYKNLVALVNAQRRPAFKQRLDQMRRLADAETARLGKGLREELILDHFQVGKEDKGELGRKCREFLLQMFPPGPDTDDPGPSDDPSELSLRRHLQNVRERLKAMPIEPPDDE